MISLLAVSVIAAAATGSYSSLFPGDGLLLEFSDPVSASYGEYAGLEVEGCSIMDGVLLPVRYVRLPAAPGSRPRVRVEALGVREIGPARGIASSLLDDDGTETFREARTDEMPADWSRVVEYGTWRRAGYVSVALYPVIVRNGVLYSARAMRVDTGEGDSGLRQVPGHSGRILSLFFSTEEGCILQPPSRRGSSPFWGKPWARVQVDTSGVFQITGEMIPEALGMPSSSFGMICGRGRNMDEEAPWDDRFQALPVPVLVEDGGDGTFDSADRVLFFGRGLSWWDDAVGYDGLHFNGRYDSLNTYWLTWGGAGGPFMESSDCSLTGAPSGGDVYTGRFHLEQNYIRESSVWDLWSWSRFSGSHPQTANLSFDAPGAAGPGTIRAGISLTRGGGRLTVILNGVIQGDTVLTGEQQVVSVPVSGIKASGNTLGLRFTPVSDTFTVFVDWVSIFPEKTFTSAGTAMEVPLGWNIAPGQRRRIDWVQNLDPARAFLINGDTLARSLDLPGGTSFEVEVPYGWRMPLLYMYPTGNLPEPVSVTPASPGRIVATLSGADVVVVYPEEFAPDMPLLDRPDGRSRVFVSLPELWDEFNGGVRDPQAVRAFMDWVAETWNPLPTDLVLVGSGHFDPRHFLYSQPCPMDVLVLTPSNEGVSDDSYGVVRGSSMAQFSVSRVFASTRSELQFLAQRYWDYFADESSGEWQTRVIAAADDERKVSNGVVSYGETYHTTQTEDILKTVPDRYFPDRQYGIFHTWNDSFKKPEWRQSFIDAWSEGALVVFYMGHGSFDQIADEGLLYLEDVALLANGHRLPYAFFGSCDVGMFQFPGRKCMSGEVTLTTAGGAVASMGATVKTTGSQNSVLLSNIFPLLLADFDLSLGEATWLGKIQQGPGQNKYYAVFGDGSLALALPDSGITHNGPQLRTGEAATLLGTLRGREGLVMVTAWESMRPDTYYTYQTNKPIPHLTVPGRFHQGFVQASPDFAQEIFVPLAAATGEMARVMFFSPGPEGGSLSCLFPGELVPGDPSEDNEGPEIEGWIQGYRGVSLPRVSGEAWYCASLEDSSGINLLPYPGAQLALYVDGVPSDVSEYFFFDQGTYKSGELLVPLPSLGQGMHQLRLRAADGLMNISWSEMELEVISDQGPVLERVWVYPNPSSDAAGFHWAQSGPGPVDIAVFSVTGRRVAEFRNLQGTAGYNQFLWNLLDADGDPVASSAYVYTVSSGGSSVTGVMAVVRDP